MNIDGHDLLLILGLLVGGSLLLALLLLGLVVRHIRKIKLPVEADLFTALRATPLVVVLVLDLLDFSLDIFSAPISWAVLTRLGLKPLRGITVVESLIPGTQFLPTMTAAWIIARLAKDQKWVDRL